MLSIPLARIGSLEMHESLSRRDDLGRMQVIGEGKVCPGVPLHGTISITRTSVEQL